MLPYINSDYLRLQQLLMGILNTSYINHLLLLLKCVREFTKGASRSKALKENTSLRH